ncbi:MAG: hypothetical protein RIR00_1503 [Pseudomonadota bacterium]
MSDSAYFTMPSPFELEPGTLLLLEPSWARAHELRQQLLDMSYPKPFVIDDGDARYLYFNVSLMQSAMRLTAPNALMLAYTRKMMAALLFQPQPSRIVLIGLGGGSLLKFCHQQLPGASLEAVELSPEVIALKGAFKVPADGPRLQVVEADGAEYLAATAKGIDLLLVDAFDRTGFAPDLANLEFFELAWRQLSGKGVLVVNLAGDKASYEGLIGVALQAFDQQVIVIPVPEDGNHILFAFKERHFAPRWRWLQGFAKELRARHGLDFPDFVEILEKSYRRGAALEAALRGR